MEILLDEKLVQRFFDDVWNQRRLDLIPELFHEPYIISNLLTPRLPPQFYNHQQLKEHIEKWLNAFPDFHLNVQETIKEDNKFVVRWIAEGTHMQTFEGIAPTGKHINFSSIGIFTTKDGKLHQHSTLVDAYGLYKKLGILR